MQCNASIITLDDFTTATMLLQMRHIGIMSAIADLSAWAKDSLSKHKCPLYTIYVDFTKAFDSIDRSRLFAKLNDMGVSATFIKAMWPIFKQNNFQVILPNQSLSDPITQTLGVPQVSACLDIYIHCIQQICLR